MVLSICLGFVVGAAFGAGLAFLSFERRSSLLSKRAASLEQEVAVLDCRYQELGLAKALLDRSVKATSDQILELVTANASLEKESQLLRASGTELAAKNQELHSLLNERDTKLTQLEVKVASSETQCAAMVEHAEAAKSYVEELRAATKAEFAAVSGRLLEEQSRNVSETNKTSISTLIGPLKEQIKTFQEKVEKVYGDEAKDRHVLKAEVSRLLDLNQRMSEKAENLTEALRGNSKVQGDWGEHILESVLEAAGLCEGRDYKKQNQCEGPQGERLRPDVLICLPQNKHLVVDSKVSLKAYEEYVSCQNPDEKAGLLAEHIQSIERHIGELSEKHYPKSKGMNSPDVVFAFVPIEGAYLLAIQDRRMVEWAWSKRIVLVTGSNLFATMRTVASVWKVEHQNRNVLEIANEAGRLYDKFVGFIDDFEKIGKSLASAQAFHGDALRKLKFGPGNVLTKIENLKILGATPTKQLKVEYLEPAEV